MDACSDKLGMQALMIVHVLLEKMSVHKQACVKTFVNSHLYSMAITTLASVQDMDKCSMRITKNVNAQEANISTNLHMNLDGVVARVQWENTMIGS